MCDRLRSTCPTPYVLDRSCCTCQVMSYIIVVNTNINAPNQTKKQMHGRRRDPILISIYFPPRLTTQPTHHNQHQTAAFLPIFYPARLSTSLPLSSLFFLATTSKTGTKPLQPGPAITFWNSQPATTAGFGCLLFSLFSYSPETGGLTGGKSLDDRLCLRCGEAKRETSWNMTGWGGDETTWEGNTR